MKNNKPTKAQQLDELISELTARMKVDGWDYFTEQVSMPREFAAALIAGRTELLKAATPRALSADECAALYRLVAVLIDTNMALREHTSEVAKLVTTWTDAFTHLRSVGHRIEDFANFRRSDADEASEVVS